MTDRRSELRAHFEKLAVRLKLAGQAALPGGA